MDDTFRVLHVCTGNICRSPTAEVMMRGLLDGHVGFEVGSAGTYGLVGEPVERQAAELLRARGFDPSGFAARRLHRGLIDEADLLLAACREHRAVAAALAPHAVERMFTLLEFARIAPELAVPAGLTPADRAREVVEAAAGVRGHQRPKRPHDDDIEDPYGRGASVFRAVADVIEDGVRRSVRALVG